MEKDLEVNNPTFEKSSSNEFQKDDLQSIVDNFKEIHKKDLENKMQKQQKQKEKEMQKARKLETKEALKELKEESKMSNNTMTAKYKRTVVSERFGEITGVGEKELETRFENFRTGKEITKEEFLKMDADPTKRDRVDVYSQKAWENRWNRTEPQLQKTDAYDKTTGRSVSIHLTQDEYKDVKNNAIKNIDAQKLEKIRDKNTEKGQQITSKINDAKEQKHQNKSPKKSIIQKIKDKISKIKNSEKSLKQEKAQTKQQTKDVGRER